MLSARLLAAAFAAALAAGGAPAPTLDAHRFAGSKPNVIILFADDFGWGDVGHNSPGVVFETAAIDALASGGATFKDFHTFPLCTPSRGQLLTGRLPIRTGVTTNFVPESLAGLPTTEHTIAELLKPAGYDTAQLGKWWVWASSPLCFLPHSPLVASALNQTFRPPRSRPLPRRFSPGTLERTRSTTRPGAAST
jgi:hypothetical protein